MINFFKKKGVPDVEDMPEEKKEKPKEKETQGASSAVELERLKAQVKALSETRKAMQDRMTTMSEQLGELRSTVVAKERDIDEIKAKSEKAADLVNEVQPEKLKMDIQKEDNKLETLRGLVQKNEKRLGDMSSRLKDMSESVKVFKGSEEVLKLNEEVKDELRNIQKIRSVVDAHADQVENMFMDVQKNFAEFQKFDEITEDLQKTYTRASKEVDEVKSRLSKKADRDDIKQLEDKTDKKLKSADKIVEKAKDFEEFFSKVDLQKRLYKLEEDILNLRRNTESLGGLGERLTDNLSSLESKARSNARSVEENSHKIDRILSLIEHMATKS